MGAHVAGAAVVAGRSGGVHCHCGGTSWIRTWERLAAQNMIRRVRKCRDCHQEFATVEVTEGTDLTWVDEREVQAPTEVDEEADRLARIAAAPAPTVRRLEGQKRPVEDYANCRGCGKLFIRWKGQPRMFCRQCIKDGVTA